MVTDRAAHCVSIYYSLSLLHRYGTFQTCGTVVRGVLAVGCTDLIASLIHFASITLIASLIPFAISTKASSRLLHLVTGLSFVGNALSFPTGVFCHSQGLRRMGMTRASPVS